MNLGPQLRYGVDSIISTESLGGDDKSWRHRQIAQIQIFQMIGLVADKNLVIHLWRHLPEWANHHLGIVCHDVADEIRVERRLHGSQRVKNASDEIIQRLHQESV